MRCEHYIQQLRESQNSFTKGALHLASMEDSSTTPSSSSSLPPRMESSDPSPVPEEESENTTYHGCEHYKRRCKIRAPCCDQIFSCRHCHNEAKNALEDPKDRHELVRRDVEFVICSLCQSEQQVAQKCINCGVMMGEYFCQICKFYDDDTTKEQFHCDDCGICRVGGRDNFFHCHKCGSCYILNSRNNHQCLEGSMKSHCPICYEYLFDSIKGTIILKCGHAMHAHCWEEMARQNQYRCPFCSKSMIDMCSAWERLDSEVRAIPMPEEYHYEVSILCNDCNRNSKAFFHIVGHKCSHCSSYNTRVLAKDPK